MAAADAVYQSVGLPEKAEKRQRDLPGGRAWGTDLGDQAGVGPGKLLELCKLTLAFIITGFATRTMVEQLLGHWNFP
jgi:hypothetical protein